MSRPRRALERAVAVIGQIEDAVLALLLGSMIVLAALQILLRNVLDTGLPWIGPLLRYMVLWLGLLGALCAARTRDHIAIDALARILPAGLRRAASAVAGTFTAGVCALVAVHGTRLVLLDREAGSTAFGALPSWCVESVIPLCFAGMALRYILRVALDVVRPAGSPPAP